MGYLSRPKESGPHPSVLVIHENRGMQPHFPDITRRYALQGYVALSVDLLSRKGGTAAFADSNQARNALREIAQDDFMADLNASVDYLQGLPYIRADRIGVTGVLFRRRSDLVNVREELRDCRSRSLLWIGPAAGRGPKPERAGPGDLRGDDRRINSGVPGLEAALQQNGKVYRIITYPGAGHAFFNDTGQRYHQESAAAAWQETLGWFDQHLKS